MGWFFSLGLSLCLFWPLSQWHLTVLNHWKSSCRCWPHFCVFYALLFFFLNLSLVGWEEWIVGVSPTPLSSAVSLLSLLVSVTEEEEKKIPWGQAVLVCVQLCHGHVIFSKSLRLLKSHPERKRSQYLSGSIWSQSGDRSHTEMKQRRFDLKLY